MPSQMPEKNVFTDLRLKTDLILSHAEPNLSPNHVPMFLKISVIELCRSENQSGTVSVKKLGIDSVKKATTACHAATALSYIGNSTFESSVSNQPGIVSVKNAGMLSVKKFVTAPHAAVTLS